jgi:hypothetical protein
MCSDGTPKRISFILPTKCAAGTKDVYLPEGDFIGRINNNRGHVP